MKSTIEDNLKEIEELQINANLIKIAMHPLHELLGKHNERIQSLQSENTIMLEEMKAGKFIED